MPIFKMATMILLQIAGINCIAGVNLILVSKYMYILYELNDEKLCKFALLKRHFAYSMLHSLLLFDHLLSFASGNLNNDTSIRLIITKTSGPIDSGHSAKIKMAATAV